MNPAAFNLPPGYKTAMAKLYGDNKAFSGVSEVRLLEKNEQETLRITTKIDFLEGKERSEIDMSQMKGGALPAEAMASFKQLGLDKMITIVRPAEEKTFTVYPGLQSYVALPVDKGEKEGALKVEKTELGKEMIDGKPCTKNKLVFTDAKGEKFEATVWNATEMKDFPIQTRMVLKENVVINKFTSVKFEKPPASAFEIPADYKKYDSIQSMMVTVMQRILTGGGEK